MSLTKVRNYAINDFITWYQADSLQISPKYQRNHNLWNHNQKSYFIDSILRDFPIPPIFMREYIDFEKGNKTIREIIDGQQRLRAIIDFKANKYPIMAEHNEEYANMYYENLPEETKYDFLYKELLVQQVITSDDSKIYEIFVRYNTNSTPLNAQELRNAKYWGTFKTVVNYLAKKCRTFFIDNQIFSDVEITRMADIEFVAALAIFCTNDIVSLSENDIDKYYTKYENQFTSTSANTLTAKFTYVYKNINYYNLFSNVPKATLDLKQFYYYLFAALIKLLLHESMQPLKYKAETNLSVFFMEEIQTVYTFVLNENLLPHKFTYEVDQQIVEKLANYIQTQAESKYAE